MSTDADGVPVPGLAHRWESPDDRRWTFYLRPEARFHHGAQATVDDVLFSLNRARRHPKSVLSGFLSSVRSVKADAAAGSVLVELDRPDPFFLEALSQIAMVAQDAPQHITRPSGTGPYRFVSYEPGRSIRLERFAEGPKPLPAEPVVEFLIEPQAPRAVTLLERGEVDLIYGLPPALVARVEDDPALWVESRLSRSVFYLDLNPEHEPLDDPRVRQAVHLAVDRKALVEEVTLKHSRAAGQMLTPDLLGFDPTLEPTARDLSAARRLLAEAGFSAENPASFRLEANDAFVDLCAVLAAQLREAGIQVDMVTRPWPELYPDTVAGRTEAWLNLWLFDSTDSAVFFGQVVHTPTEDGKWGGNFRRPPNAARDEALEADIRAAFAEADAARRETALKAINRRSAALNRHIPLIWPLDLYGLRRQLEWQVRRDNALWAVGMRRKTEK